MDVKKVLILLTSLALVACNDEESTSSDLPIREPLAVCASQAITGKYIVKWKNGNVQKVNANTKTELQESWLKKYKDEIAYIQPEMQITVPKPVVEKNIRTQVAAINWQHEAILSQSAWDENNNGQEVLVAVIDSGVNVNHPQLASRIAINTAEIPNNNIDDDGNGLVDDYKGYDFYNNSGNIGDGNGHGSHVAGIIAAEHIDENHPLGVAPAVKILALSFMSEHGAGSTSDAIRAIYYAYSRGAKVINASWGSSQCDTALRDAISEVTANGVLFVAAAGNDSLDLDIYQTYPTSFGLSGVINVAASTDRAITASFSNYGRNSVEVAAPGKDIYSTYIDDGYATLSGTSMAAPIVSGVAALALVKNPNLNVQELKAKIIESTQAGLYPVISGGEVNVANLLNNL